MPTPTTAVTTYETTENDTGELSLCRHCVRDLRDALVIPALVAGNRDRAASDARRLSDVALMTREDHAQWPTWATAERHEHAQHCLREVVRYEAILSALGAEVRS